MLLAFRIGLIASVLPIVLALFLIATPSVGGAPMMVDPECDVTLQTDATTRTLGEEFDVNIVLAASAEVPVSAAQVYLNFDPAVLEVVDASGNPATAITPGDVFASPPGPDGSDGTWTDVLQNSVTVNGADGRINFAGGRGTSGSNAEAGFVLATVRFKARAAISGTEISFNTSGLRQTKVMSGVNPVTGQLNGVTIVVEKPIELVDVTFDNITLQGRDDNDDDWTMPMVVEFYDPDTKALVYDFNPTAEGGVGNSPASFQVSGVEPGTYDVWVKGENTLAKFFNPLEISATSNTVGLGVQIGGDFNGDNEVNSLDYSAFVALFNDEGPSFDFSVAKGDLPAEHQLHDYTWNGVVDIADYGLVVTNFGQSGQDQPQP